MIKVKHLICIVSMALFLWETSLTRANELNIIPPPASAHSTTDILLLRSSGLATVTSAPPLEEKAKNIPHSDGITQQAAIKSNDEQGKVDLPIASQKTIDNLVNVPSKSAVQKSDANINPYHLEKQYGITTKKTQTVTRVQRPVLAQNEKTQVVSPPAKSVTTVKESEYRPKVDEEGSWQASGYRFSPELNKVMYLPDSPLKMITLQIMVQVSSGPSVSKKARVLLDRINNALPDAVLIAGLRELFVKDPVYPLAQWDRHSFAKAIKRVSSHKQANTIGYGLQEVRPSLLNLPYPLSLLLITDGEHYNIDNLAFDTKIFYAPDPRSPLNIVSFATTREEKESIRIIQRVHKGTHVFDGYKLLQDEGAFTAFMKTLFVK